MPSVDQKRRLPVLKSSPASDEPVRPGWQWVIFAVLLSMVGWVLLSSVVELLARTVNASLDLSQHSPESVFLVLHTVPHAAALAVACSFAGKLVGRYGGASAGIKQAALGGLITGLIGALATFSGPESGKLLRAGAVLFLSTVPATLAGWRAVRRR